MDASHPILAETQEKAEAARVAKAAKAASAPNASIANLKTKQDQMTYLLEATVRIQKSLACWESWHGKQRKLYAHCRTLRRGV